MNIRMKRTWAAFALVSLSMLMPLSVQAKDGDVIKRVDCSRRAEIKLKASPENGRIEVEAEIDEAVPGQRWRLVLKKNGRTIFNSIRTVNRAGNIEVRRLTSNGSGPDRIAARARNLNTGESCAVNITASF